MYSNDLKVRAINLYNKVKSYRKVEDLFNIGKSTVQRWVNNISSKKSKNEAKLFEVSKVMISIKKYLDKDQYITIKNIQNKLFKEFKKRFSFSLIHTTIKYKLKYSYKKVNTKYYSKSVKELKKIQKQFIKRIKYLDLNKIICIDETYLKSNYAP